MNASNTISAVKERNRLHTRARNSAQAKLLQNHREEFNRLHKIEREKLGLGQPFRGLSLNEIAAAAGFKLVPIGAPAEVDVSSGPITETKWEEAKSPAPAADGEDK